jgi:ADP-ribose pyrophosphatase
MKAKDAPSRIIWQGRSWGLRVFQQAIPGNHSLERGIIEHPGSVVIVPVQEDRILMLSQYRLALDKTILELPAGTRNWDEDWQACAERELREETGYRGAIWTSLGRVWPAPGITNELMAIYLATDLSWDPLPADEDEEIEVRPLPIDQAIEMALDGRLMDAKSIVGLLRARTLVA